MLANYLGVGTRNILQHKTFSLINVFGLAAAMSVCMLIIMIIADQRSYDQFQVNKDRIYRIQTMDKNDRGMRTASSALPLAELLRKEYTGIEASVGLMRGIGGDLVYKEKIASGAGYFTDHSPAGRQRSIFRMAYWTCFRSVDARKIWRRRRTTLDAFMEK